MHKCAQRNVAGGAIGTRREPVKRIFNCFADCLGLWGDEAKCGGLMQVLVADLMPEALRYGCEA